MDSEQSYLFFLFFWNILTKKNRTEKNFWNDKKKKNPVKNGVLASGKFI